MISISVCTPSIRPEGLAIVQKSLASQTFKDFEWLVELGVPGQGHDLNAAYNRMLRRAKGELIVSLQDFIKAPPEYLQKFWDAYKADPKKFYTAPVGKVDTLDYTGPIKWDWRAYADAVPTWRHWEIDSGCAPLAALKEIGGFDEELDKAWSCDNVNTGFRADLAGYTFGNVFNNSVIVYDHDAHISHPFRERFDPALNSERMEQFKLGLKIHYV